MGTTGVTEDLEQTDAPAPGMPGGVERRLRPPRVRSIALTGLFVLACLYTLAIARVFLMPLALGVMCYFLLRPAVRALRRLGVPEYLGAALVLTGLVVAAVAGLYALSWPAENWVARAPESLQRVEARLEPLARRLQRLSRTADDMGKLAAVAPAPTGPEVRLKEPGFSQDLFGSMQAFMGQATIVFTLVFFLLAEGDAFSTKVVGVIPRSRDRQRAVEIAREMERQISSYILWTTLVNAGFGLLIGLVTWALGMPNPGLWGFVAFVTNFVPYLGALVCSAILALAALLTFPDPWHAMLVPVVFLVLNTIEGYVVTPLVMGRQFTLDTPLLFVGLLFWWYVWGIPGALLAVPMMSAFKIFCDRVEGLQGMAELLGGTTRDRH